LVILWLLKYNPLAKFINVIKYGTHKGCLVPIKVINPEGSILCPHEDAAVVGGNVLTSQRVVDVILKAFQACAASQGCMNNVTFGHETVGYYETVAGGAGAVSCVYIA
jgi:5-oxoprolinase (ATP-hydrolysing)